MNRRQALKVIKTKAKAKGLDTTLSTKKGKGSHSRVYVGSASTILPGTVSEQLLKAILKQLKLE